MDDNLRNIKLSESGEGFELSLTGLLYKGDPTPLDTRVEGTLDFTLSWKDRETFAEELQKLINKFKI